MVTRHFVNVAAGLAPAQSPRPRHTPSSNFCAGISCTVGTGLAPSVLILAPSVPLHLTPSSSQDLTPSSPQDLAHQARRNESASGCHPERSEGSHAMGTEILRCAQDDTRVLSIPAVFWSTLAGLLNEDVGVKGLAPSLPQHHAINRHTTIFPSFKNNTSSTHTSPLHRRSHTISQCRAD